MRCFVAIDLPEDLRARVIALQKDLPDADIKNVEPENLHFTLKFLGEINEAQASKAKDIISAVASSFSSFKIEIKGVGVFPSLSYVRVVWVGAPLLYDLQKAVDSAFYPDFPRERNVTPHLTIARVRSPLGKEIAQFVKKHAETEIGSMIVDNLKLKKSRLTPKGPVYDDLAVMEIGK